MATDRPAHIWREYSGSSDEERMALAESERAGLISDGYAFAGSEWRRTLRGRVLAVHYARLIPTGSVPVVAPPGWAPVPDGEKPRFSAAQIVGAIIVIAVVIYLAAPNKGGISSGGSVPALLGGSRVDHVRITYNGCWSGSVLGMTANFSQRSVEGCGAMTYATAADTVSVVIQKKDDSKTQLTVDLMSGSSVVASESTTAAYGVASVAK